METKNKLIKTAKGCYVAAKVLYCLSFAVCLAFIILAIVLPLTGHPVGSLTSAETAVLFATLALYTFICIGLLWNVEGLFKCVARERSPFNEGVNHYLKKIAIFVLALAIVPAIIGSVVMKIVDADTEIVFPVSVAGIIGGIVLFFMGWVFHYGMDLQKQDDETL